jgi:hypothetical protein
MNAFDDPGIEVGPQATQFRVSELFGDEYRCAEPYDAPAFDGRVTLEHSRYHRGMREDLSPNLVGNFRSSQFSAEMGGLHLQARNQVRFGGPSPGERAAGFRHQGMVEPIF